MLTIVIVDYNSIDRTIQYILELSSKILLSNKLHIIIVDVYTNMSMSVTKLQHEFGQGTKSSLLGKKIVQFNLKDYDIVYAFAEENLGYARGNNLGVHISSCLFNDDYILISNNDIVLLNPLSYPDIISIFKSDDNIGVVGPRIIGKDGKNQSPCKYIGPFKGLIYRYWLYSGLSKTYGSGFDLDYSNENKYCYRVMGSFMFVRKKAFEEINGFDENTFLYYEESILSERMIRKGYATYFYNDYTVLHNHGVTTKKIKNKLLPYKYEFHSGTHYYKQYRKLSLLFGLCSKLNFALFEILFLLKKSIKKVMKKDG